MTFQPALHRQPREATIEPRLHMKKAVEESDKADRMFSGRSGFCGQFSGSIALTDNSPTGTAGAKSSGSSPPTDRS